MGHFSQGLRVVPPILQATDEAGHTRYIAKVRGHDRAVKIRSQRYMFDSDSPGNIINMVGDS